MVAVQTGRHSTGRRAGNLDKCSDVNLAGTAEVSSPKQMLGRCKPVSVGGFLGSGVCDDAESWIRSGGPCLF